MARKTDPCTVSGSEAAKIPCIFPLNREMRSRDGFADDCLHRHQLSNRYSMSLRFHRGVIPSVFPGLCRRVLSHLVAGDAFVRQSAVSARARLLRPIWQYHCLLATSRFLGEQARRQTRDRRGSWSYPAEQQLRGDRTARAAPSTRGAGGCLPSGGSR
jgi:hypothetical protein